MPSTASHVTPSRALNEPVLDDEYPVYCGYAYVADGLPVESPVEGNVRRLKAELKATEIRRCDMFGRRAAARAELEWLRPHLSNHGSK